MISRFRVICYLLMIFCEAIVINADYVGRRGSIEAVCFAIMTLAAGMPDLPVNGRRLI